MASLVELLGGYNPLVNMLARRQQQLANSPQPQRWTTSPHYWSPLHPWYADSHRWALQPAQQAFRRSMSPEMDWMFPSNVPAWARNFPPWELDDDARYLAEVEQYPFSQQPMAQNSPFLWGGTQHGETPRGNMSMGLPFPRFMSSGDVSQPFPFDFTNVAR